MFRILINYSQYICWSIYRLLQKLDLKAIVILSVDKHLQRVTIEMWTECTLKEDMALIGSLQTNFI